MPSFNKFRCFVQDLGRGVHDLDADVLKVMLTNVAPDVDDAVKLDITEISAGSGYSAGGGTVANNAYSQASGLAKLTGDDVTFTASGGDIAAWQYAVLYNDTPSSPADPLIGWWDYATPQTITAGNSKTVDFSASSGVLQLT